MAVVIGEINPQGWIRKVSMWVMDILYVLSLLENSF